MIHVLQQLIDTYFAYVPRPVPQSIKEGEVRLMAHRGAHDHEIRVFENTHEAFQRAMSLGCHGIELDVHASADGVLVVNHDPSLKRLWGHDVAIRSRTFHELRSLVPQLPSLAEVVDRYGKKMHLFIELKAPFTAIASLTETLKELTPSVDYHLICLDETTLPTLTAFPKASLLLVPEHHNVKKFCQLSLEQHYGGVLGHYLLLQNKQIKQLRAANQLVGVGFVDSKYSLYRELNRGMYLLFTNKAETIARCLQKLRS